jgi:hypothetical protein
VRAEPRRRAAVRVTPSRPEPSAVLSDSLEQDASVKPTTPNLSAQWSSCDPTTLENSAVRANRVPPVLGAVGAVAVLALGGFFLVKHKAAPPGPPDVSVQGPGTRPVAPEPQRLAPNPALAVASSHQAGGTASTGTPSSEVRLAGATTQRSPGTRTGRGDAAVGTLRLSVKGRGRVQVDGKYLGDIPGRNEYPLPVGEHLVELSNPRVRFSKRITLLADRPVSLVIDMTGASK